MKFIRELRSVILRLPSGTARYHEPLQSTTSGTTRNCEGLQVVLRVVLRVTTRKYECYYNVLRGTASCTSNHYEVLREV